MVDFFQISRDGEHVGKVTSACHSPRLEKSIGYAMIPIELAQLGAELEVDVAGDQREVVVVEMPFIDPNKESASNDSRPNTDRQDRRSGDFLRRPRLEGTRSTASSRR